MQPPSGGCVLKQAAKVLIDECLNAATFGWLCVETSPQKISKLSFMAATFGWLCVETDQFGYLIYIEFAATFGWLCVETQRTNTNMIGVN